MRMDGIARLAGGTDYVEYLLRARREFEQGRAATLNDVRDVYRRAAEGIHKDINSLTPGTLRQTHLTALQTALDKRAAQMSKEVLAATHQGIWMASGAGSKGVADVTAHMVQGAFPAVRVEKLFEGVNERATLAMLARTRKDGLKISDRVWRASESARNSVRMIVEDAVARGQDARTTAKQVQQYLQPGVWKAHKAETANRLRIGADISYQAMRLARTEMNNAFHEGAIAANQHNPGYLGIYWRLSDAHVVPDICCIPGTMITTRTGLKAIEQVIVGDEVLTHQGHWQPVICLYQREIQSGEVVRLQYQGEKSHTLELTVTPNHPVLTEQGWIPAGSLQKGCTGLASLLWQHELSFQCHNDARCKVVQGFVGNETSIRERSISVRSRDESLCWPRHKLHKHLRDSQWPTFLSIFAYDFFQHICHFSTWGYYFRDVVQIVSHELPQNVKISLGDVFRNLDYWCRLLADGTLENNIFGSCCSIYSRRVFCICGRLLAWLRVQQGNNHLNNIYETLCLWWSKTPSYKWHSLELCAEGLPYIEQRIYDYKTTALKSGLDVQFRPPLGLMEHYTNDKASQIITSFDKSLTHINYSIKARECPYMEVIKLTDMQYFNAKGLMVYNLKVACDNSYFANGVAVHNCTDMAADTSHGDPGFYPKGKEPVRPHPQCFCNAISSYEDPEKFTERLREWRDNPSLHSDIDAWYTQDNTRQILGRAQL